MSKIIIYKKENTQKMRQIPLKNNVNIAVFRSKLIFFKGNNIEISTNIKILEFKLKGKLTNI